jgi:ectoine hydroxylase-related dioxygenase (phytanoyl-CoA dioxygenase family)
MTAQLSHVQEWHSDGPPSAPRCDAYGVCVFVPLIDLNETTGCTQFWPGSHVHQHLLGFGPAATVLETAVEAHVTAGCAVLYDYRVLHRGLENTSSHGRRDVLQVVYHKPEYCEKRNYSTVSLVDP